MTAHERLRQLCTDPHQVKVFVPEPIANALPQLANLAEAAARIAGGPDQRSIADGWDSIARAYQRDAARALADLEAALNPTRNTQSPT